MSDVQAAAAAAEPASADLSTMSEDDALAAVWDQEMRDNGAERGEDGRFASPNKGEPAADGEGEAADDASAADAQATGEDGDGAEAGAEADAAAAKASAVPLPANWTGMDEDWKKIPADVQAKIAARDAELHGRMSEQGRQLGVARPIMDVVEKNADLYERHRMPDGSAVPADVGIAFLMSAQRQLDADPVRALIDIADRYDVRPILKAVLNGQANLSPPPQPKAPAGLSPADVQAVVRQELSSDQEARQIEAEISRLSKDKPLYAEIAEADMVHAINKARQRLGDAASREAVFTLAYDIAVNADPDLRAKAAAAAKAAGAPDPKAARAADQRRAAGVNLSSTSSGKARQLTDEELLSQVYDAAHSKDR